MYTNRLPFHADVAIKQYFFLTKLMYCGNTVLSELFSMFGENQRQILCVKCGVPHVCNQSKFCDALL